MVVEILLGAFAINIGMLVESSVVKELGHIGFLFLMFLAGIKVDIDSFKNLSTNFIKKIAIYFFWLYALSILIVLLFDLSIIYVAALPTMSLGIIVILMKEYKDSIWSELAFKIAIIGELLSITMLVILDGYYAFGLGFELYSTLGVLVMFSIIAFLLFNIAGIVFWWFPNLKSLLIPEKQEMNRDIRYSMMIFFVMIAIVTMLKIESVLGAFMSGVIISSFFKTHKNLHNKLNDIGFGFLIPLFFVHVGTTLDIERIFATKEILFYALEICAAMLFIRLFATGLVFAKFLGNINNLVLFGLASSMPFTFLIAIATLGLNISAISMEQYYSFVLAAMIEAICFTIIIKILVKRSEI